MNPTAVLDNSPEAFIERWKGVVASELATSQSFIINLCELLNVPRPHATPEQEYMFERPVTFTYSNGDTSAGRVDCYHRGRFVAESKKQKAAVTSERFSRTLQEAHAQAQNYARALPPAEGRPPFMLVIDVGTVIEVYSEFSRSGGNYIAFPDPRSHRIALADLVKPEVRERLRLIWTDPDKLDPALISADVTRKVSDILAKLAKSMEEAGHAPELVGAYLTRALFSMFAEDVKLLPEGSFLNLLKTHRAKPLLVQQMLESVWSTMDSGGFSGALAGSVLRFNGKLFKGAGNPGYSLLLTTPQIDLMIAAARNNWRKVEPAIFGTLLERALNPRERHSLGAHYTPRAYVERLVMPTVIEPLRGEWANVQAAALLLVGEAEALPKKKREAKMDEARLEVRRFHHRLCTVRVLDPACGSGNFLYVTLEHLKRLEGEVFNQLADLGDTQSKLLLEGETVTLQQLRGIELNPRAAALAELVLWIGYLQWQIRTFEASGVAEPVVHDYGNIECRDAVLAWDGREHAVDANGAMLTRWDGVTMKVHPVTGALVPDEEARTPQWKYLGARKAEWPKVDFIVGNPPFIGKRNMRAALGDGYVECLRATWKDVPDSADFVMYWWHKAAGAVTSGAVQRMGFITTNSLRQTFNRRLVQAAIDKGMSLAFVIPDHPWVDSTNGAAVRIAMSVGTMPGSKSTGQLQAVISESSGEYGEVSVLLNHRHGSIQADLSIGADLDSAVPLEANLELSNIGVYPLGAGFLLSDIEASALTKRLIPELSARLLRTYRNGRDLTESPRNVIAIDTFGYDEPTLRQDAPAVWQRLHDRVKPERDQNPRKGRREKWWRYGEDHPRVRRAIAGLPRYVATVMTAKHRVFQFLDGAILPDQKLVAIGVSDPLLLGVLSSSVHQLWALKTGATLEDRPVYVKTACFETFPFADIDTGLTSPLRERIGALAEQLDAHRKTQQAAHSGLTLTGMYNVLEVLRVGRALTDKEKVIHEEGLVGLLKELHDELDAAVLKAYGWQDLVSAIAGGDTSTLLVRLVALNAKRAAEEAGGLVRWLRPDFQAPTQGQQTAIATPQLTTPGAVTGKPAKARSALPWPTGMADQIKGIADLLSQSTVAMDLDGIAAHFTSRGRWRERLPAILDTLVALGRVHVQGDGRWVNVV